MNEPAIDPDRTLDEQMLADWAAVGIRRFQVHLALQAAFCDFLRTRSRDDDPRQEPCPHRHAP